MKFYKKIKIKQDKVSKVVCDYCGDSFDEITVDSEGYGQIEINFGYGSEFDGDTYEAEICDKCFKKLLPNLKVRRVEIDDFSEMLDQMDEDEDYYEDTEKDNEDEESWG